MLRCQRDGCHNAVEPGQLSCETCQITGGPNQGNALPLHEVGFLSDNVSMTKQYPKYYKEIPPGTREVDVYAVCKMFPVNDPSGCINHARKKLLVPGTRTGGKSFRQDIKEARDTLTRWLELNPEAKD